MGLKGRLEAKVELRSSGDLFHELLSSKPHHVPKASPQHVQGCELLEGDFSKPGSVICWRYTVDGKEYVDKARIETVDEVNKMVSSKAIEGDILNDYAEFISSVKVTPKAGALDVVKWTLNFETIHDDAPYPTPLLAMLLNVTRDIENHHLQA